MDFDSDNDGGWETYNASDNDYEGVNDADAWYASSGPAESSAEATPITVTAGATATAADNALPSAGTLSGTVTANGAPVSGVDVTLFDSQGNPVQTVAQDECGGDSASDSDGDYTFYYLLPGTYKVEFSTGSGSAENNNGCDGPAVEQFQATGADAKHANAAHANTAGNPGTNSNGANLAFQFYDDVSTLSAARDVTVIGGSQTSDINAALTAGGEITGTVTDASSGADLASIEVQLLDASGDVVDSTESLTDGNYVLSGVPSGSYDVEFLPSQNTASNYQIQYYGGSQVQSGSTAVTVTAGSTTSGIGAALQAPSTAPTNPTSVTTPGATVTTPGATVTTPGATVTTPGQTITVPTPTPTPEPDTKVGRPTLSGVKLAGISSDRTTLSFKLSEGANATPLKTVKVLLPQGFTVVSRALKQDLKLSAAANYTVSGRVLTVTLKSAEKSVTLSFKAGAISVTKALVTAGKRQKIASEKITVAVTSSSGVMTTLSGTVKQPD